VLLTYPLGRVLARPVVLLAFGGGDKPTLDEWGCDNLSLMSHPDPRPSVQPEFERLTRFERPKAERRYQRWASHFQKKDPGNDVANRQRSLNLAYIIPNRHRV
jgi:hypothetical protein